MFMYEDIFICIFRNYQQIFPDLQYIVCIIEAFKIFNIQKLGNLGPLQNDSFWEVQFSMNFCFYIYLNVKILFFHIKNVFFLIICHHNLTNAIFYHLYFRDSLSFNSVIIN